MDEIFSLSDGMGTFLYAYQDEEDKDFVVIELEEEDEYNNYSSRSIELHKSDVELLIKGLKSLV